MQMLIDKLSLESVDMHCHGIGRFDFTEIPTLQLQVIEETLAERGHGSVLTLYLPKWHFEDFLSLMQAFHNARQRGELQHVLGIGLEGPVLASHGGTPGRAVWTPSKQQWREIAECGQLGLMYVILSPDAETHEGPSISWITETLLTGCVLPAPGHFAKTDPVRSARALQALFAQVGDWGRCPTITDHLFNDMPLNFRHAWRTPTDKKKRAEELKCIQLEQWTEDNIEEQLGPVPATMIRAAWAGIAKICQNFDGEHVDLAVAKRTVDLIGAENMLMMTDSIESKRLGGQNLHIREGSTLLFQDQGIVAAGSQCVRRQIANMLSAGLEPQDISTLINTMPRAVIAKRDQLAKRLVQSVPAHPVPWSSERLLA